MQSTSKQPNKLACVPFCQITTELSVCVSSASNSDKISCLFFLKFHLIHFINTFGPKHSILCIEWCQNDKSKGNRGCVSSFYRHKDSLSHSRDHYPSTPEILRWQPFDWQRIRADMSFYAHPRACNSQWMIVQTSDPFPLLFPGAATVNLQA